MDVGAQPDVKTEVPADMVRVFINHHLVGVPEPVVAEAILIGGNTEIETAKPEVFAAPSGQPPDVFAAKASCEVPMLPRMIEVVVHVFGAGGMPNPFPVGVNMRSVWMPCRIVIIMSF